MEINVIFMIGISLIVLFWILIVSRVEKNLSLLEHKIWQKSVMQESAHKHRI